MNPSMNRSINRPAEDESSNPTITVSQPMPITHRSLSQSSAASPMSPSLSSIPFLRRLFPPNPTLNQSANQLSTSVPTENHMDHLSRHGPMALSYRRHSIDVSSLRSLRAADEASHHMDQTASRSINQPSAFVDESVDASTLSAKANGQTGPSRMLEGFCKYEWDFSG